MIPRITPVLLLDNGKLVKTKKFGNPVYVGDPLNAIRIYSQKHVDEIIIIDISKGRDRKINFRLLARMTEECFSPLTYGGGINSLDKAAKLFSLGVEKICMNNAIRNNEKLGRALIDRFGSQSIIASIDVIKIFGSYRIYSYDRWFKYKFSRENIIEYITSVAKQGYGELLINFVDRDGMYLGYDVATINQISSALNCPITVCGGCRSYADIWNLAKNSNVSGIAAGSVFVFRNERKGVLINYPTIREIERNLGL